MKPTTRGPARDNGLAEAVFVALDSLEQIAADLPREDAPAQAEFETLPRAGFDDIYRFANDPTMAMSEDLRDTLNSNARLRADLRHLVERAAEGGALPAAAASSGTITTRHGTSFRMTLRQSRADNNQVYVLIHLVGKRNAVPRALFVIDDETACRKVPLPMPLDGTVQLLLDADSDIAAALRNPANEVFIQ